MSAGSSGLGRLDPAHLDGLGVLYGASACLAPLEEEYTSADLCTTWTISYELAGVEWPSPTGKGSISVVQMGGLLGCRLTNHHRLSLIRRQWVWKGGAQDVDGRSALQFVCVAGR